jgi:hypothetical protein
VGDLTGLVALELLLYDEKVGNADGAPLRRWRAGSGAGLWTAAGPPHRRGERRIDGFDDLVEGDARGGDPS